MGSRRPLPLVFSPSTAGGLPHLLRAAGLRATIPSENKLMNDKEVDVIAEVVGRFLAAIVSGVFLFIVVSTAITFFWNRVVPDVFHLSQITFSQGVSLTALAFAVSAARVLR